MPARAAARIGGSPGRSRASASVKSLRIAKWMRGSRLPSASTSTCSSSAATESVLVSSVGTTTIVRASSGMPIGEVEASQTARRDRPGDDALSERDRDVSRRDQQQQHQRRQSGGRSALVPSVRRDPSDQHRRHDRDRRQVDERRVREHETSRPAREPRSIGDVVFEVAPPPIDEVIADVGGPVGGRSAGCRLARAFDRPERDPHLRVAARRRQFLDRLALSIATEEVHPSVRACRIALQDVLDQTHGLDVLAPIERRTEPQAGNGVGDRHLVGGLPLVLAANRGFRGRLLRARCSSTAVRIDDNRRPYSRSRCSSWTTEAMPSAGGNGRVTSGFRARSGSRTRQRPAGRGATPGFRRPDV